MGTSQNSDNTAEMLFEHHFTLPEIARRTRLSVDLLRREFTGYPGVLLLDRAPRAGKLGYCSLRIPRSAFEAWYKNRTVGGKRRGTP